MYWSKHVSIGSIHARIQWLGQYLNVDETCVGVHLKTYKYTLVKPCTVFPAYKPRVYRRLVVLWSRQTTFELEFKLGLVAVWFTHIVLHFQIHSLDDFQYAYYWDSQVTNERWYILNLTLIASLRVKPRALISTLCVSNSVIWEKLEHQFNGFLSKRNKQMYLHRMQLLYTDVRLQRTPVFVYPFMRRWLLTMFSSS